MIKREKKGWLKGKKLERTGAMEKKKERKRKKKVERREKK